MSKAELLDIIAMLLACFHYDTERKVWQTEVIKRGHRARLNNFAMRTVAPRCVYAIERGKEALGQPYEPADQREWWELEGG